MPLLFFANLGIDWPKKVMINHTWSLALNTQLKPIERHAVLYFIEQGLMPSIVGAWGYYINFMGEGKMKQHWRYIVARYGAFPVAWTLCGESRLPWYGNIGKGDQGYQQTFKWAEVGHYVRTNNPTGRLVGIHPGPPLWFHDAAYEALPDYSMVDIYYGMGGHGNMNEYADLLRNLNTMDQFRVRYPGKVSLIGEFAWEGMYGGNCGPFVQRIQFWGAVLNGAPGSTGAVGVVGGVVGVVGVVGHDELEERGRCLRGPARVIRRCRV